MQIERDRDGTGKQRALSVYEATVGLLERRASRNTEQMPVTARVAATDPDAAFAPVDGAGS